MRKIAIANRKGGVGKSTTAVHLAHALARRAQTGSLLIDTDTQVLEISPHRTEANAHWPGVFFPGHTACSASTTNWAAE